MSQSAYNIGTLVDVAFALMSDAPTEPRPTRVSTGLENLDAMAGGMTPGQRVVIAAHRGVGSTAFAVGCTRHVASGADESAPRGVLYLALEAPAARIVERLLAMETGTPLHQISQRAIPRGQWALLSQGFNTLAKLPLHIHDEPFDSIDALSARIAEVATLARDSNRPLALVVIDSLDVLARPFGIPARASATQFAMTLRDLATAHRVVIALTHHVRRRDGWRTGALSPIAYAADRVLTLDRPAWFDPSLRRDGGEVAKIQVVRNRSGRESSVSVWFRRETAKFDAPVEFEACEW